MVNVFAVPVFFICFRESLETVIIVSILLAFLKQTWVSKDNPGTYKKLVRQVWFGTVLGLILCIIIGAGMIGGFYGLAKDTWSGTEEIWEGVFALLASIIITLMGAAMLRVSKLQDKWRIKLTRALEAKDKGHGNLGGRIKRWSEKYAMFILPFITVLREGLEAVVFIGGVGLGLPATAFPLAVIAGLAAGCACGFIIYKIGNTSAMQVFLVIATCFLYLVAAGLFSRSVWYFEQNAWNKATGGDAGENGSGPGSYDIRRSVWHINCCNPRFNGGGGWGVFNALFGWQNSATFGSVISYNVYWIVVILGFLAMTFYEKRGHWPFMQSKHSDIRTNSGSEENEPEKGVAGPFEGKTASASTKVL